MKQFLQSLSFEEIGKLSLLIAAILGGLLSLTALAGHVADNPRRLIGGLLLVACIVVVAAAIVSLCRKALQGDPAQSNSARAVLTGIAFGSALVAFLMFWKPPAVDNSPDMPVPPPAIGPPMHFDAPASGQRVWPYALEDTARSRL